MEIQISGGTGTGPTKLAAFDAALRTIGIANYNLIRLSSVIPSGSQLVEARPGQVVIDGGWGDRLYIVAADMRVDTPNAEAWAGIGWVQNTETGEGLFVEHEGHSESRVRHDIEDSLKALIKGRGLDFGPIQTKIVGATCHRNPVCALTVAVFCTESWPIPEKSLFKSMRKPKVFAKK